MDCLHQNHMESLLTRQISTDLSNLGTSAWVWVLCMQPKLWELCLGSHQFKVPKSSWTPESCGMLLENIHTKLHSRGFWFSFSKWAWAAVVSELLLSNCHFIYEEIEIQDGKTTCASSELKKKKKIQDFKPGFQSPYSFYCSITPISWLKSSF